MGNWPLVSKLEGNCFKLMIAWRISGGKSASMENLLPLTAVNVDLDS